MSRPNQFHLAFDPPATPGQIKSLCTLLKELDWDAPGEARFDENGTINDESDRTFSGTTHGCAWVYWKSPAVADKEIVQVLETVGLRGFGYLQENSGFSDYPPQSRNWLAFGGHPYQAKIDADGRVDKAKGLVREAEKAILTAARDDLDEPLRLARNALLLADVALAEAKAASR